MEPSKGCVGVSRLASVLAGRMGEEAQGASHPALDFGTVMDGGALLTDSYPIPIPKGDYLVCRHLTLGGAGTVLSTTVPGGTHEHGGGEHPHSGGGHSGHSGGDGSHTHQGGGHVHQGDGAHTHLVPVPEKMRSLRAGDRVLVAWRGSDAVVIDLIVPATGGGG